MTRRKPIPTNRVPIAVEEAVVEVALEQPAFGQVRVANELKRRGLAISPAGVRCVWQRQPRPGDHEEAAAGAGGQERPGRAGADRGPGGRPGAGARQDNEAHGEFESGCPGYCGAQDTFYV